jgi:uncharacterized protein with HEPN domain
MRREARKYLDDIAHAAELVTRFTAGRTFDDFASDAMLRAAVEREFEISGEAITQLAKIDEPLAARISDRRRIIAFRNILIHGYADVDHRVVWSVVERDLPVLRREIDALIRSA